MVGDARSPGHVFYDRLQSVLIEGGFDAFAEASCRPYYAARMGAPSVPPGRYFRMHLVGYFEGIDSERGLEWRCSDSLSLRAFLRLGSRDRVPDHSWLSRSRTRLPHEVHAAVFDWVLVLIAEAGLIKGERIGVDASTMEANAALRNIVRLRDSKTGPRQRIARQLEGLRAVRLHAEGRPYPPDRRVRQSALPGHRADRPMGRLGRRRLQRPLDDLGHLFVRERPRPSRPRLIRQPLDALLQEAAAPLADRVLVHAEFGCHRLVRQAVCAAQDHAAAIGDRARDPAASNLTLKIRPFFIAQNQDHRRRLSGCPNPCTQCVSP